MSGNKIPRLPSFCMSGKNIEITLTEHKEDAFKGCIVKAKNKMLQETLQTTPKIARLIKMAFVNFENHRYKN